MTVRNGILGDPGADCRARECRNGQKKSGRGKVKATFLRPLFFSPVSTSLAPLSAPGSPRMEEWKRVVKSSLCNGKESIRQPATETRGRRKNTPTIELYLSECHSKMGLHRRKCLTAGSTSTEGFTPLTARLMVTYYHRCRAFYLFFSVFHSRPFTVVPLTSAKMVGSSWNQLQTERTLLEPKLPDTLGKRNTTNEACLYTLTFRSIADPYLIIYIFVYHKPQTQHGN